MSVLRALQSSRPPRCRRHMAMAALCVAAMALLASCQDTTSEAGEQEPRRAPSTGVASESPVPGGVLRLGNRGEPPAGWDPMRTSSIALHHVAGSVFGPGNLVKRCRANMYMVCPYLATSWTSNQDFTEWTFNIRQGVSWHDGEPLRAEDITFWFELAYFGVTSGGRTRAPAYFRGNLGRIEQVEALPGRVRVTLAEPTVRFPEMLLDPRMKVAHPEHLMRPLIEAGQVSVSPLDIGLVGLGPFHVTHHEPNSHVQLRRFDGYWERDARGDRLPYLDGIDYIVTPDPVAMDLAMRTGRLHGGARGEGHYLSAERQEVYERAMGESVTLARIGGGTFRLAFNVLLEGPWQDERVRRAIALWIDGDAAVMTALGGQGYLSVEDWPGRRFDANPFMLWPHSEPQRLERDRLEARRLLADAGHQEGFAMGHLCRGVHLIRCEFLQEQLRGLGIELVLRVVDEGEWNRARLSADHDTQPGANFSGTVPEATEAVYGRYARQPDAYAKHDDERVDELYRRLRAELNLPQRVSLWRDLEHLLVHEEAYLVPIAMTVQVVPYSSSVRGLVIPPEDGHTHTDFATVWLTERR